MTDLNLAPLLAVAGATASGKTSCSLWLAQELGSDVIGVDSVQMFRGCDIGSAKIKAAERQGVLHHLLDVLEPNQSVNAGIFCRYAETLISEMREQRRTPLFCVGTTMYFSALLQGLVPQPPAAPNVRARVQALSSEEAYAILCQVDSQRAQALHPRDRARVTRALEVFWSTGQKLGAQIEDAAQQQVEYRALTIMLCWPREALYQRINERSRKMLQDGLLDEVSCLRKQYGDDCLVFSTLGYKQAFSVLRGELALAQLGEEIATATRQFAKRQLTFWRNEPTKRSWVCQPQQLPSGVLGKPGKGQRAIKHFESLIFSRDELLQRLRHRLTEPFEVSEIWYVDAAAFL